MSCNNLNSKKKKNKFGNQSVVPNAYYGDYGLPYRGMVSAFTNGQIRGANSLPFMKSNYFINNVSNYSKNGNISKVPVNYHSFGSNWYPNLNIDTTYSTYSGGYSYPNASMGPYVAVGLGNYPNSMLAQVDRLVISNSTPKPKKQTSQNKFGKSKKKNYK